MALTPSGAISLADINTALNRSATAPISMGDAQVRYLANQDTGSVTLNNMRNKQSTVGTITVGYYNDGKSEVIGYQQGVMGSLSSNTFFDETPLFLYTDVNSGGKTLIRRTSINIPNVAARLTVNGVSVSMTKADSTSYASSGIPAQFTSGMVNNTYTWQFAQT